MNFAIESESFTKDKIIQIDFLNHFKGYAWTISNNKSNLIGLGDVSQKKRYQKYIFKLFPFRKYRFYERCHFTNRK